MLVTVFSDASWCPKTKAGGWGAWAKSERVQWGVQFSGAFRRVVTGSNEAEIMAAACALASTLRSEVAAMGDTILFEIDNEHALRLVAHDAPTGRQPRTDLEKEAIAVLLALKSPARVDLQDQAREGPQRPGTPRPVRRERAVRPPRPKAYAGRPSARL